MSNMKSKLPVFLTVISAVLLFNSLNMLNSYWLASSLPASVAGADAQGVLGIELTISLIELVVGLILLILACFVLNGKE